MNDYSGMLGLFYDGGSNWLILAGLVVLGVGVLAVFIIPKWLNNALGLISMVGVLALAGAALFATQFVEFSSLSRAEPEVSPEGIKAVSVSPTEFRVSWRTPEPVVGALIYGISPDGLKNVGVGLDPSQKRSEHVISVGDLAPGSVYYVKIISGGEEYPVEGPLRVELLK